MQLKLISEQTRYLISDTGKVFSIVRSVEPKELSPGLHRNRASKGYYIISLYKGGKGKSFYVHQLVADAFLPPRPFPEAIIRHLDGDSLNNKVDNLSWGTWKEDAEDKIRCGTINRGTWNGNSKLTNDQIDKIKSSNLTGRELSKLFNVCEATISMVKSGQRWGWVESKKRLEGE